MHLSPAVVAAFAALCAAAPLVPGTHVVHEKRMTLPPAWVQGNRVEKSALLPVRVGLKQQNLHKGPGYLYDVSDPKSKNYGKHWTAKQVHDAFAPLEETVNTVRDWIIASGISADRVVHSENKGWLAFDATAAEVEGLLHTEFYEHEHDTTGKLSIGCEKYHLPAHVSKHVDYITPGVKLAKLTKRGYNSRGDKNLQKRGKSAANSHMLRRPYDRAIIQPNVLGTCDVQITPACIAALYQIPSALGLTYTGASNNSFGLSPGPKPSANNTLGIFEEGDYYAQEDLNLFWGNFTPYIPQGTHPIPAFIDGAVAPVAVQNAGGESDLDFQIAYPIIYPQQVTLYQTDDTYWAEHGEGFFNTFLDALDGSYCTYSAYGETGDSSIDPVYPDTHAGGYTGALQCGVYTPTNVISVSYGGQEDDVPYSYQERQCNEFLKLGLQGTSIFFASGDDGVAGPGGDSSKNGCLGGTRKTNGTIFSPAWPNSCPWLTNVGATKVNAGMTVYEPESAVVDPVGMPYSVAYSSGGGFSNLYPIPSYQATAVANYFANYNPPYPYYSTLNGTAIGAGGGIYNRIGRGYPDLAANGDNYIGYNEGEFGLSGGTSMSTPIVASIVNRIVEQRIRAGKGSLGFINPVLYANPGILNDIVNGTNPGCGTVGFNTAPGWDPVTGLGTPNYPKMLALFMSLP